MNFMKEPKYFAVIFCKREIKFPYYLRVEHQQGEAGHTYYIPCYSFAELDYYRELCHDTDKHLLFAGPWDSRYETYRQVVDGGFFGVEARAESDIRDKIDGKLFEDRLEVRNHYDGSEIPSN